MPQLSSAIQYFTALVLFISTAVSRADDHSDFFERAIRPVLIEKCSGCHGAEKQSGEFRVDSRDALLQGGDTGPAIVPGKPTESLLIEAVERSDDIAMPPDESLPKHQVDALKVWVSQGAIWPKGMKTLPSAKDTSAEDHWAFQPVARPDVPTTNGHWAKTPIDTFILKTLRSNNLQPSAPADRRTLLRRATYAVTGLPPSAESVQEFINDNSPDAWNQVIERLLSQPAYGEHWARHWLDVARYSDTKGYVYAREERFWVHAWSYRDWVVEALNSDMPYDRFLLLQLAADQVPDRDENDLAAMGFLTLGRRFLGLKHDIFDDRIDVVCRGTMGLTVSCARCHDHKYDPIPTADYYSLYGVFDSCTEQLTPLAQSSNASTETKAFAQELAKRQNTLQTNRTQSCLKASQRNRNRIREYLIAQTELEKYPPAGFDQIISEHDVHPRVVSAWNSWLYNARRRNDPVFRAWHEFEQLPEEAFADEASRVTQMLTTLSDDQLNPLVAEKFLTAPSSFVEVVEHYADLLSDIDRKWLAAVATNAERTRLVNPAEEQLREILYGAGSPCVIPDEHIANISYLFPSGTASKLWKNQGEVDRWIRDAKHKVPFALTLVDRAAPSEPRIFQRGVAANPGEPVPRRFLSVFATNAESSFQVGSGRRELADRIVSPDNPLTARVIVNRVWAHLFGQGLVSTPSDFGLRAERPSHPELLDWLTSEFFKNNWSLKKLTRLILTSAVFQQRSQQLDEEFVRKAELIDPENRLLWRMKPHRLSFEEFRDSLLRSSGELQTSSGGKAFDLFKKTERKPYRTIYGLVDRQFLPGTMRTFDFANPDLHIPKRSETTVPQQALFFMNHELVLEQVKQLTKKSSEFTNVDSRISYLFQRVLQREPTKPERNDARQLVTSAESTPNITPSRMMADWSYGYGKVDETNYRLTKFTPVPHFTGSAWQGGKELPDTELGWVNLTATGGHPGNTRDHACVRRWTAPRNMTVSITSKLTHEPTAGDGVRAFVLASGAALHATAAHNTEIDLNVESVDVRKGQQIDFVVDINKVLNSDQFLWQISVTDVDQAIEEYSDWNSQEDFHHDDVTPLTPWEQLTHVLTCTNEFMFVD